MTTPAFQLSLDGTRTVGANGRPLTDHQRLVWNQVTATPGGITADEAGALVHAHRLQRPHSVDVRCERCAQTGRSVLESAALKPLLIRRRGSGRYEPRNPAERADEPCSQLTELQGETWEEMFGEVA